MSLFVGNATAGARWLPTSTASASNDTRSDGLEGSLLAAAEGYRVLAGDGIKVG
jgi:hypothetical protein